MKCTIESLDGIKYLSASGPGMDLLLLVIALACNQLLALAFRNKVIYMRTALCLEAEAKNKD
jgi:hypothetical protein